MVLFGFLIGSLFRAIPLLAGGAAGSVALVPTDCFCVIGYIIPGLIALWMDRQGWVETVSPLLTSSVAVRLILVLVGVEVVG